MSPAANTRLLERLAERTALRVREDTLRVLRASEPSAPGLRRFEGRTLVDFGANDYLGLARDPRITEALRSGAELWGVGAGAAHLLGGHTSAHEAAQEAFADWCGRQSALLFGCGYMANLGVAQALLQPGDRLIEDKLNHASLLDAARISGARLLRYRHLDTDAARLRLATDDTPALLVTDSVFSMDGDEADLCGLAAACADHGAELWVDDAHGLGVLGEHGSGSAREAGLGSAEVPVYMATLGKAVGVGGACVAGDSNLIQGLVQFARTFVYTTGMPPALAVALQTAIAIARREDWRRQHLQSLIAQLVAGLQALGLSGSSSLRTPIQPVLIGDSRRAMNLSSHLMTRGFWAPAIRPPTVPEGAARLRLSLSAAHSPEQVGALLGAIAEVEPLWRDDVLEH